MASGQTLAATANPQNVTVAKGSVNSPFNLSGSGTNWTLVTGPAHGTVLIYSTLPTPGYTNWAVIGTAAYASPARIQYTPLLSYTGSDSFAWYASDTNGTSATVVCSINITSRGTSRYG